MIYEWKSCDIEGMSINSFNLVIEISLKRCVKYNFKIKSKWKVYYIWKKSYIIKNILLIKIIFKILNIYKNWDMLVKVLIVSENILFDLFWIIVMKKINRMMV